MSSRPIWTATCHPPETERPDFPNPPRHLCSSIPILSQQALMNTVCPESPHPSVGHYAKLHRFRQNSQKYRHIIGAQETPSLIDKRYSPGFQLQDHPIPAPKSSTTPAMPTTQPASEPLPGPLVGTPEPMALCQRVTTTMTPWDSPATWKMGQRSPSTRGQRRSKASGDRTCDCEWDHSKLPDPLSFLSLGSPALPGVILGRRALQPPWSEGVEHPALLLLAGGVRHS